MAGTCAEILAEGVRRLALDPDEVAIARLCRYYDELRKWSRRINLVAAAPRRELLETHFLDSLTLWPLLANLADLDNVEPGDPLTLLDVGSGAGFPGLALKCWRPRALAVTLMEPRLKRVSFLRHVIRTLELKDGMRVLARRLEPGAEADPELAGGFEVITSRAFTTIAPFLELCAPLSPPGGLVVCMKGPRAEAELADWQARQPHSPYCLDETADFILPFSGARRHLLVFRRRRTGGVPPKSR